MDAQLKRGLFEAAVLRTLKKGDSYGYMIIKDLPPELEATESTLYPILKRLESSGCVRVYSVEHNSRLRRYYSITESGEARIKKFLEDFALVMKVYNYIDAEEER